jgi:hypothetical protein
VCFVVHKTTSELEYAIFTTLYLADAKKPNSWHARKGDLQRAFPSDVPMVPSSALIVVVDDECLSCGGLSFGETVRSGSLKFITNYFDGLSPSPRGTVQMPPSWAQHAVGHRPRYGP